MKKLSLLLLGAGLLSCKQLEKTPAPAPTSAKAVSTPTTIAATQPASAAALVASAPTSVATSEPSLVDVEKAPAAKQYPAPVERRLYTSRIEASHSKGYHPFFLMDNDPESAWGFPKDAKAWARVSLSTVEGVTKVRVRIKPLQTYPGYYPKKVTLTALPGGQQTTATLAANEDWQEISLDLESSPTKPRETVPQGNDPLSLLEAQGNVVSGIELAFSGFHDKKPKDTEEEYEGEFEENLKIAEIEVYVTGLTIENPAFEKAKLEQLLTWKKIREQSDAAATKSKPLPVSMNYKVKPINTELEGVIKKLQDDTYAMFGDELNTDAALKKLTPQLPPEAKDYLDRAAKALKTPTSKWTALQVSMTALKPYALSSEVKGLSEPAFYNDHGDISEYAWPSSDDFLLPRFSYGTLLLKDQLSISESAVKKRPKECEKTTQTYFWRLPETVADNPNELIVEDCLGEEERGGVTMFRVVQVVEYDALGHAKLWVTPYFIEWFDWTEGEKGTLLGGVRLTTSSIDRLAVDDSPKPTSKPAKP